MLFGVLRVQLVLLDGLDGHRSFDDGVETLIDDPHRAVANGTDDVVFTEFGGGLAHNCKDKR